VAIYFTENDSRKTCLCRLYRLSNVKFAPAHPSAPSTGAYFKGSQNCQFPMIFATSLFLKIVQQWNDLVRTVRYSLRLSNSQAAAADKNGCCPMRRLPVQLLYRIDYFRFADSSEQVHWEIPDVIFIPTSSNKTMPVRHSLWDRVVETSESLLFLSYVIWAAALDVVVTAAMTSLRWKNMYPSVTSCRTATGARREKSCQPLLNECEASASWS
jgi:hypothetical protein